jgi:hypothetical protein
MLNLQAGDQIELSYEDAPATTIRATVGRLLTDRYEGMGIEVEDYVACWLEITVDEPSDMDAKQIVFLGTDFQCRLNGRPVTVRKKALEHAMNKFEQPMTTHHIETEGRGSVEIFRARRRAFRALHEAGCFVIPNPWDVGSARYLRRLGFPALATTSAGCAFSQGLPDSECGLTCERNLAYIADIAGAVDIPVNADFASGYGASPQDVAENVTRCIAAGVAGLSIEDATGDPSSPLYELSAAVKRVRAAREAIDQSRADVVLTARAECFLVGHRDALRESVKRLQHSLRRGRTCYLHPAPTVPRRSKHSLTRFGRSRSTSWWFGTVA